VKIISVFDKEKIINGLVLAANEKKTVVASEYGVYPYYPERLKR
jgi:hypothetical protein